jgi:hypothetical protein
VDLVEVKPKLQPAPPLTVVCTKGNQPPPTPSSEARPRDIRVLRLQAEIFGRNIAAVRQDYLRAKTDLNLSVVGDVRSLLIGGRYQVFKILIL